MRPIETYRPSSTFSTCCCYHVYSNEIHVNTLFFHRIEPYESGHRKAYAFLSLQCFDLWDINTKQRSRHENSHFLFINDNGQCYIEWSCHRVNMSRLANVKVGLSPQEAASWPSLLQTQTITMASSVYYYCHCYWWYYWIFTEYLLCAPHSAKRFISILLLDPLNNRWVGGVLVSFHIQKG